ncbi:mechanosensitive ion channel protein MscS [Endozoicomonas sp. (ex Bugula neritina AB1)]|nr:mechanosensitive ion channel protein MscS [Endozoicomonas sp. (ex Bugula neritina AB1)]
MEFPAVIQNVDWSFIQGAPSWLVQVLVALSITYCASFFLRKILTRLASGVNPDINLWANAALVAGRKPANYFLWVLGISWSVDIIWRITQDPLFAKFDRFSDVLLVVLLIWWLIRMIRQSEKSYLKHPEALNGKVDATTAIAMGRLLRISILIIGLLIIMQSMGYSISGVLAFGGVGGLAVGLAAKDMLANFFGGLMIYLDKPFRVGDWVRSPDRQIEGTVQYIGWRQTRILTFDKRPLYVPNAAFMNISVENPSRMENRRIKETIGLRYSDARKVNIILKDIREYLNNSDVIDKDKIIMVNFNTFGASSLDFFIYCFTKTTDWAQFHMEKEQVLLDIMNIIHGQGGDIAFPTQTLDLPAGLMSESTTQM